MKKISIVIICILVIIVGLLVALKFTNKPKENLDNEIIADNKSEEPIEKVDIIDLKSKTRPFAVSINNTPVAVKVQQGLNDAYMVYQIPTEGNTSRLIAFFKDAPDNLEIGTIRSARHNMIDFALESDAIFCAYGWSHWAEDDMKAGAINYLQGYVERDGDHFYRKNPEKLASEHTAYTTIGNLKADVQEKKYNQTTDKDTVLLKYDVSDVELSNCDSAKKARTIQIPYGSGNDTKASFKYDEDSRMYVRYQANTKCVDYKTKEDVTTKNIIVQKVDYKLCSDQYYWDLITIGSGKGVYITNGYAVDINWKKTSRKDKTKYTYAEGTVIDGKDVSGQEITVSDGRTWIEVQTTACTLTIEE